jgi:hypothetical protein
MAKAIHCTNVRKLARCHGDDYGNCFGLSVSDDEV